MRKIIKSILFIFFLSVASCAEDLDFGQYQDLEATPSYEASILYLEAPEDIINLAETGTDVVSKNFNFDAFSSEIFSKSVLDGTIVYLAENTTNTALEITIDFLDEEGTVTDTEIITVQEAPSAVLQREISYGDRGRSIEIIKTLTTIRISAKNLGRGSDGSNLTDPKFTLKSSGKFRVLIK